MDMRRLPGQLGPDVVKSLIKPSDTESILRYPAAVFRPICQNPLHLAARAARAPGRATRPLRVAAAASQFQFTAPDTVPGSWMKRSLSEAVCLGFYPHTFGLKLIRARTAGD
jgi:hypothetical protein